MGKLTIVAILIILKIITVDGEPSWMYKNVNKFIGDFHEVLALESNNGVFSAFGTWLLLSMTYHGAAERTRNLFHPAIGHSPDHESRRTILKAQKEFIKLFKGDSSGGLIWINKIYLANDFTINPEFNRIIKSIFQSSVRNIDFYDPIEASDTINYQIDHETDSTFSKVVIPADFNRKTQLVLVNAIKFTGRWKHPFDISKTRKEEFQLGGGRKIYVPTMSATFMCDAGILKNIRAQYVVLLFKNEDDDIYDIDDEENKKDDEDDDHNSDKMIIIYPTSSSTLRGIEEKLQNEKLASIQKWKNKQKHMCNVHLPKFKIESNWNLEEPVKDLGLKNIFTHDANFNRMTNEFVSVNKILQNVKININEKGCSSSALSSYENDDSNDESSSSLRRKSSSSVRVDRPFLVFIIKKGVISLSARVTKPCFC